MSLMEYISNVMTSLQKNYFQDTLCMHFGIHTCWINQTYLYCFLLKNTTTEQ